MCMRLIAVLVSTVIGFPALAANKVPFLTSQQQQTRDDMEKAALQYFLDNAHPVTGLVRDKANSFTDMKEDEDPEASTASTGIGLAIIANASKRGFVTEQFAKDYFNKTMRFVRDNLDRNHGWFLHWIDWRTGKIVWEEANGYSTLDTSFLIAGALYAAAVFPDEEGARIAQKLYEDMDFIWMMTDGGKYPERRTLSLDYRDGLGFSQWQLSIYAEQILVVMLGLGHPTNPLPVDAWHAWERRHITAGNFSSVALDMPLFIHQYSHMFIDFRDFKDRYENYFEISKTATLFNRYVANHDQLRASARAGFWGYSAGQAPGLISPAYHSAPGTYLTYKEVYGVYDPYRTAMGVMCIACVPGSAMFTPEVVLNDSQYWRDSVYGPHIWGRYGFTDSLDVDQKWYSEKSLGITVGTTYLSLANTYKDNSIWEVFNNIPAISKALNRIRE